MNQYMVDMELLDFDSDEFLSLIPEQRNHINELMVNGTISSFSVSIERNKVWATFNADSEEEVLGVLDTMPMRRFLQFTIHELALFNVAGNGLPAISLN